MNTPVNFETAKLLKEKGFEQKERPSYLLVPFSECTAHPTDSTSGCGDKIGFYIPNKTVNAPTIAEVVMWLYEKHAIWIAVTSSLSQEFWKAHMTKKGDDLRDCTIQDCISPTEAYQIAIEHTLTHFEI